MRTELYPREHWHARRPHSRRCAPGCFGCFYGRFMARELGALELEAFELSMRRPRAGHSWPGSNYFRALMRACADKRRAAAGPIPAVSEGDI